MRLLVLATLAVVSAAPAQAATARPPLQVARDFFADIDAGKFDQGLGLCASDAVFVDEFAPHVWSGDNAAARWLDGFAGWMKANKVSADEVSLGAVSTNEVHGDTAYLVAGATEAYVEDGRGMVRPAHVAMAFRKEGEMWKITAMTWGGAKPTAGRVNTAVGPTGSSAPTNLGRVY